MEGRLPGGKPDKRWGRASWVQTGMYNGPELESIQEVQRTPSRAVPVERLREKKLER